METDQIRSSSAYEYPLLIKHILKAPIAYNPDTEIVYRGNVRLTYKEFHRRIGSLATALVSLGVKKGDTVAVLDWDSHRYLECYFAIPMIGAVLHTVNVRLSPEQLAYTIDHAEDTVILVHADFLPLLQAIRGKLERVEKYVLMRDQDSPETVSQFNFSGEYEQMLASSAPMEEFPDFDENTRATTFYTTGTTGLPKGVYFSHRQLVLHTVTNTASLASISGGPNFHSGDVYMPITPMFHVHAWGIPYIATFMGVKQIYPGKYIPYALNALIKAEGVTFSHCVPTILAMLLKDPSTPEGGYAGWKVIIGGAALPKPLAKTAFERGIDIFAGYGMSETGPVISFVRLGEKELNLPLDEELAERTRTGTSAGLTYIRIIDSNGKEVPNDDRASGEIVLRAPWLTQGYFKDRSNSEKLWEGGWLHTQDVAVRNGRGSVRITDRLKDVIKVGGEWLSSLEIEDIIAAHTAISECAVVAKNDDKWGEIPLALIVVREGMEAPERSIIEHVKGYIDRGMLPREAVLLKVLAVPALEKTSVGKINKLALRSRYCPSGNS